MSKGSRFALALVLFWLAFVCFYAAFHPGGVQMPGPDPDTKSGTTHNARNPSDIVKHVVLSLSGTNTAGGTTNA